MMMSQTLSWWEVRRMESRRKPLPGTKLAPTVTNNRKYSSLFEDTHPKKRTSHAVTIGQSFWRVPHLLIYW